MKKVLLCILDGVGIRSEYHGNAFLNACKPNFDFLYNKYPHILLDASGKAVGLPMEQMGNSEVGHLNIGSGRIVYQSLELVNNAFLDGTFNNNQKLNDVFDYVNKNKSRVHVMGLLSDGGVHSSINHFYNMVELCSEKVDKIYAHVISDGRDTKIDKVRDYIKVLKSNHNVDIASISGRYYAMDRDKRFDRTDKYFDTIRGNGLYNDNLDKYILDSYEKGNYDEFIEPCLIDKEGIVRDNDVVIWINFRPDRARQIIKKIVDSNIKCLTMMKVSKEIDCPYLIENIKINDTLGSYLSKLGIKQLRIAETEKYAHVTYFFDGGLELDLTGCDKVLIPSSKVATYDLKPEMSAYLITDKLLSIMEKYEVIILNYANGDMVGHTGNYNATVKAVEVLDEVLGIIYKKANELGFTLIVTSDHGNCDYMLDEDNKIVTTHSLSKVPFILCDNNYNLCDSGKLCNIAPTILDIMEIEKPTSMNNDSLIISKKD